MAPDKTTTATDPAAALDGDAATRAAAATRSARSARLVHLAAAGVWLIGMVAIGLPHAIWRHVHVDEAQIAYNIALWGVHGLDSYTNYAAPFMVPLAWLIGPLDTTASMLLVLRTSFFLLFAWNLVAVAIAQPCFRSRSGRLAVLFGVTLFHPFWAHGFEIRHDAVLVAGSIALYGLAQHIVRRGRAARWVMIAAGAIGAAMQLDAYKGFLYVVPFGGTILVAAVATRWHEPPRCRLAPILWFAAGGLAAAAACVGLLAIAGHLDEYATVVGRFVGAAGASYRFSPVPELVRVALDAPLVYGPAALFLVVLAVDAARRRRIAGPTAVTAVFLIWNLIALFINPVPFPYNFLHITPFVFLAALDLVSRISIAARARPLALAAALSAAALLFARSWRQDPFLTRTSEAQLSYAAAAEAMTDPATDTVLDGAGLVLSRRPPGPHWMLHSLWMADYRAGRRTSFGQMMIDQSSPVLLGNYRWSWLPAGDLAVRQARYVQLYPELWVLGSVVPGAAGEVAIHRAGRYMVRPRDPRDAAPALTVDGRPLPPTAVVALAVGSHHIAGAGGSGFVVHWLGPRLDQPPAVLPLVPSGQMFTNE
ncbi:MAG TPA: hypothetical protein VK824_12060 [Planctomycetota bacterium]|nr:hypothetical protein [Planctomycetota bacterium]